MDTGSFDEPRVGSELERFILSHASLKAGDKLEGKVIQVIRKLEMAEFDSEDMDMSLVDKKILDVKV